MEVTFEFWGPLERRAGAAQRPLSLPAQARTVADALASLAAEMPDLAEVLERAAVAVGDRLLHRHESLEPGMRLALLPPVAGG